MNSKQRDLFTCKDREKSHSRFSIFRAGSCFQGREGEEERNDVISSWHVPAQGDAGCPEGVNSGHRISHLLLVAQVKIGIVGKF